MVSYPKREGDRKFFMCSHIRINDGGIWTDRIFCEPVWFLYSDGTG